MEFKSIRNNYYFSSFFWSTLAKVLNAIFGFISIPLLLGYFGKVEYGILSIATACNGYMHIMDLGMNTGAVKFFSEWKSQGKFSLISSVARTNISFYLIISVLNIFGLVLLALFGECLFSVTHSQFLQLRVCLYILALFSVLSWCTTAFNQLLIADKNIAFTQKVSCIIVFFKSLLLLFVFNCHLTLFQYFFLFTFFVSISLFPYAYKCKKDKLILSFLPGNNWKDFKVVITFSLSIFALSLFQVTASQSRPIILSIFSVNGAEAITDFRIVEVIPQFIIMICGTFLSIFLPKSTEIFTKGKHDEIEKFIVVWTRNTTIIVCFLSFPFIVSADAVLRAYVGNDFSYLSKWLVLWCLLLILQLHSSPAYSMILAQGKTFYLVLFTAISSVISIIVNILFCKDIPVGSAILGYAFYMLILVALYYTFFYKKYLNVRRDLILKNFILPFVIGLIACVVPYICNISSSSFVDYVRDERFANICVCIVNTLLWMLPYSILLYCFNVVNLRMIKNER